METSTIVAIVVGCLVLAIIGLLMTWKKVPQDKAVVVTGLRKRVITGSAGIVIPGLEATSAISLENMKIEIAVRDSLTSNGVELSADGVAVVKVKSETNSIYIALEQFNTGRLDGTIDNIKDIVRDVLEGKLREIVSKMTIEEVYKDREAFAAEVQAATIDDLGNMGLEVKAFTIREISDPNGYLKALGAKRIAEVKRDAEIAKATAEKEIRIEKAEALRQGQIAELESQTKIAESEKEKQLKESAYKKESQSAKAEADMAYQIKQNVISQEAIKTKMEAELIQKDKDTELAFKEAKRKEAQYLADVNTSAEAEKYRIIKEAEAEKAKDIAKAEADARRVELEAEAAARRLELEAEAESNAIRKKGQAEAEAIRLMGEAEAEAMNKRAEAYKQYGEAAMAQMMVDRLPEIAAAIAAPLAKTEKIVIVDNGSKGDGATGAGKVTGYVTDIMSQLPEVMQTLTGFDMMDTLTKSLTKTNSINTTVVASDGHVVSDGQNTDIDPTSINA